MLNGLLSGPSVPARDRPEFARLRASISAEPAALGRLALAVAGPHTSQATSHGLICAVDGVLYRDPAGEREDLDAAWAVLTAYRSSGIEGLAQLRGRYHAVIWDPERQRGALVSDLLATRPWFMTRTASGTLFAGELPELLQLTLSRPGANPIALATWLTDGECPDGLTLFEGVTRLGPGEYVALGEGTAQPRRYWQPRFVEPMAGARAERAEALRDQVYRSTARRMSSAVNGVVLSGGLDSSIVTAAASAMRTSGATVATYSGVFPGEEYDETWKIREVVDGLPVRPTMLEISPQGAVWSALRYTQRWSQPLLAVNSLIDIAAVHEAACDDAEIVLDGQTGDEVLGYSPYLVADRLRQGRLLAMMRLIEQWPLGRRMSWRTRRRILQHIALKGVAPHWLSEQLRARRAPAGLAPAWLTGEVRTGYLEQVDRWRWKLAGDGPLWWRYLSDSLIRAPHRELRLEYLRHRGAAEGVIAESPLYDADVIDFVLRLPPEYAYDWRMNRPLARQAMAGHLPEQVRLATQKANFFEFALRVMVSDAAPIGRLLSADDAEIGAYVELDWVRERWAGLSANSNARAALLPIFWRIAAAEIWLRGEANPRFLDQLSADPALLAPETRKVAEPD